MRTGYWDVETPTWPICWWHISHGPLFGLALFWPSTIPALGASLVAQMVKNLPANAGDLGSIPGLGGSSGEGHCSPLQYSCLENFMDRRSLEGYSPQSCKDSDTTEKNLIYNLSNYNRYISIYHSNNPQSTGASEALCCVSRLTRSPCLLSLHNFSRHWKSSVP